MFFFTQSEFRLLCSLSIVFTLKDIISTIGPPSELQQKTVFKKAFVLKKGLKSLVQSQN